MRSPALGVAALVVTSLTAAEYPWVAVRAEQTNVKGEGRLSDPTLDFVRDATGKVVDSNPNLPGVQPALIVPTNAGLPYTQLTLVPEKAAGSQ